MSALFNHSVINQIALDAEPAVFLNLASPRGSVHNQVVSSAVIWGGTGLSYRIRNTCWSCPWRRAASMLKSYVSFNH